MRLERVGEQLDSQARLGARAGQADARPLAVHDDLDGDVEASAPQLDLARETGSSLGKVNYCLNALIDKGLNSGLSDLGRKQADALARREHAELEGGLVLVQRDQHLLAVGREGVGEEFPGRVEGGPVGFEEVEAAPLELAAAAEANRQDLADPAVDDLIGLVGACWYLGLSRGVGVMFVVFVVLVVAAQRGIWNISWCTSVRPRAVNVRIMALHRAPSGRAAASAGTGHAM